MEVPIIEHYQAKGETVNSEGSCVLLTDEMKPANAKRTCVSNRNSAAQQCPSAYD
jgi:hypothetical protein